ncbi:glycosyltransferase family 2 protein [Prosthecobacter sp.]|uniref:glycosyltransferase family 2 protein n=1 Tax=Prosthecobacter sp. TaxID=1965333 RepID=UPI003782FC64
MPSATPVSFIVSNFNGGKYLPRLVESLRAQEHIEVELIIVDRQSTDDSPAFYAQNPWIKVIQHPPETGLVSGYAEGFKVASHNLVHFSNEDMWYAPECLRLCVEALMSDDEVAAVMPTQYSYDGTRLYTCGIWFQRTRWSTRALPYPFRKQCFHKLARTAQSCFANAGSCLVRRSAYEQAGGWDVSFFLDGEDTDLGMRFWQMGWKCLSLPEAIVGHAVGASNTQSLPNTKSAVGQKRYVHALSNFMALGIKYFSARYLPLVFLAWMDWAMRDLIRGRFHLVLLDLKGLNVTIQRIPSFLEYRKSHRQLNRLKPGENFFKDPIFDYSCINQNRAESIPWELCALR